MLKTSNIIHTCYTRERTVHMKQEESSKPFKISHISKLYEFFLDFVFVDDKKGDVKGMLRPISCIGINTHSDRK